MSIRFDIDPRGVARITFARPEKRNAFDGEMLSEITRLLTGLPDAARVLVLSGEGKVFSSGADLAWMMSAAQAGGGGDSAKLDEAFTALASCRVPVVGRIQGAAMAGATGLVACCDIAIASGSAVFGFSEVKIGLIPAVISPYIMRKTGYSFTRAAFVSGERFSAGRAYEVGLVHQVVPDDQLDEAVDAAVDNLLTGGPEAIMAVRSLVDRVWGHPPEEVRDLTVDAIAARRNSPEAQEGIRAFLEKRRPSWAGRGEA